MKRSCHPNLTDGKFAKSNPFHFKTTHKRLIFNCFKELLIRFNGTAMIPNIKGCGLLNFRKDRVLTKDGMSKSKWDLPDCFKKVEISYHPNPWKGSYFKSADKGQEFVFDATPSIIEWVKQIIL